MSRLSTKCCVFCFTVVSILVCTSGSSVAAVSQDQTAPSSTVAPDNSATNKNQGMTADQQSNHKKDGAITRNIRKAIVADKSLSMYAHNVKIITVNGTVTLKGPVHSDAEKDRIAGIAAQVAGDPAKVVNDISIKP